MKNSINNPYLPAVNTPCSIVLPAQSESTSDVIISGKVINYSDCNFHFQFFDKSGQKSSMLISSIYSYEFIVDTRLGVYSPYTDQE